MNKGYHQHDLINCDATTFSSLSTNTVICPGVGNEEESVGSLKLKIDEEQNVTINGIDGKAIITNASGIYKPKGDYKYVADSDKQAPQFDLKYTYEKNGKYFQVTETLVLRQDPLYDLRVETW